MSLLIITSADDVHADYVVQKLQQRGAELFRFHPDRLLSDYKLQFSTERTPEWFLSAPPFRTLNVDELRAVYYRKPKPVEGRNDAAYDSREFCLWEGRYVWDSFLNYLHDRPQIRWINDDRRIRVAEDKPAQLLAARRLGLQIPDTLVTNDPALAFAFYEANQTHGVIVKSFISRGLPAHTAAYTHKLACELTAADFDSVVFAPTLLQRFVNKICDIRAIVIGDDVYAFRIESQLITGALVDFRAVDMRTMQHSVHELPIDVAAKLRALARSFGLVHAECDLCIDSHGEYIFLEMNPNGQWLWLELQTGVPVAEAFIEELLQNSGVN